MNNQSLVDSRRKSFSGVVAFVALAISLPQVTLAGKSAPQQAPAEPPRQSSQSQARPVDDLQDRIVDNFRDADYASLASTLTLRIRSVEQAIAAQDYTTAELEARDIFNGIRIFQPMVKMIVPIRIEGILTNADLGLPFSALTYRQRSAIMLFLQDYRGGYYFDLLNLGKRAKLLQVKARYMKHGDTYIKGFTDANAKQDLIEAYDLPILLWDRKADNPYMLFDRDVRRTDHVEAFNKEIIDLVFSIKDLQTTKFSDYEAEAKHYLTNLRNAHLQSIQVAQPQAAPVAPQAQKRTRILNAEQLGICSSKLYSVFSSSTAYEICSQLRSMDEVDQAARAAKSLYSTQNPDLIRRDICTDFKIVCN